MFICMLLDKNSIVSRNLESTLIFSIVSKLS